ncbi:MAG TPA: hypothetical protein VE030_03280, partial [Burkholderiales bacterium]|nr:hypothetical protein [Burkholderiales bacterium]
MKDEGESTAFEITSSFRLPPSSLLSLVPANAPAFVNLLVSEIGRHSLPGDVGDVQPGERGG